MQSGQRKKANNLKAAILFFVSCVMNHGKRKIISKQCKPLFIVDERLLKNKQPV